MHKNTLKKLILGSYGLHCGSGSKESTCNVGDLGLIPGLEDLLEERVMVDII